MPIYDYECPRCGMIHEDQLEPPETCDNCDYDGKPESFNRLFPSRPAISKLMGKGFHDTDYPRNG